MIRSWKDWEMVRRRRGWSLLSTGSHALKWRKNQETAEGNFKSFPGKLKLTAGLPIVGCCLPFLWSKVDDDDDDDDGDDDDDDDGVDDSDGDDDDDGDYDDGDGDDDDVDDDVDDDDDDDDGDGDDGGGDDDVMMMKEGWQCFNLIV